jgi:hypothetical protein
MGAGEKGTGYRLIAQSGRFPANANTLAGFIVEGEQHHRVHPPSLKLWRGKRGDRPVYRASHRQANRDRYGVVDRR